MRPKRVGGAQNGGQRARIWRRSPAMRMDCDALSPMRTVGPQGRYASMSLFANILIGLHRLIKYLTRKERLL